MAKHLICPIHERLLGRQTFRVLRELEVTQWLAPTDIAVLRTDKLRRLFEVARSKTRFYRDRLPGIDQANYKQTVKYRQTEDFLKAEPLLSAENSRSAEDLLADVPLLNKATIRATRREMAWDRVPGGLILSNTGGSTGEPLQFFVDRRRQTYDQASRLRTHRWFGVDVGNRELFLWGSPIELTSTDQTKRVRDWLFNHRLISAFDMSPQSMDSYLDLLEAYRPTALFGYPSSIALLADHARRSSRRVKAQSLRAVFVTGEVCHDHIRDRIEDFFQVNVVNGYGSREAGFIAHQCPQGNMHVNAENVIVEIIVDGRNVPLGTVGEIVVTQLDCYAMPLIRYRTGDMGRLLPGRCSCGRGLPLMDVVHGRETDFLYSPDGTVKHALSIIYPLRELGEVRQFRVVQNSDYSVRVEIACDHSSLPAVTKRVEKAVREVIPDGIALSVQLVDKIPVTNSGKYRYVESHVRPKRKSVVLEN